MTARLRLAVSLLSAAAIVASTACAEPAPTVPIDRSVSVPIDRTRPNWRMESEGTTYEGTLARFFVLDGNPMIQLINHDAVNVGLAIRGEMTGERVVAHAFFAEGRGAVCERVGEEGSFRITFEPAEDGWLAGTFSGMLGCPDYRAMPVDGSFYIEAPPARQGE